VECKVSKEFKEWFKVIEIADLLGLSKVSVYNKLKTLNSETLQSLQRKEKGITYYNYKIIDILRDKRDKDNPPEDTVQEAAVTQEVNYLKGSNYKDDYIQSLNDDVTFLREQVKSLNDRLAAEQELHRNTQVLFKQQLPQDVKSLEAHQREFDMKLTEIRNNMEKKKNEQKDSIFKKIFGKNK
jgi:hypothetical protein